jgi:hypothetical protein
VRVAKLEAKLKRLRKWMWDLQEHMQSNPVHRDAVMNARRLFVGCVPPGTTDVSVPAPLVLD